MTDDQSAAGRPGRLDRGAAIISNLCLVHCLALPIVAVLLPAGLVAGVPGGAALHGPAWVHWALLLLALPVSLVALHHGFRAHRRHFPGALAGLGFVLMAGGALLHDRSLLEPLFTVAGGALIGVAHWRNIAARRIV